MKYTQGPWRVECDHLYGFSICMGGPYPRVSGKISREDANLIVAAPQMYEALKLALPILEVNAKRLLSTLLDDEERAGKEDGVMAFLDMMLSAIAKAEGRE